MDRSLQKYQKVIVKSKGKRRDPQTTVNTLSHNSGEALSAHMNVVPFSTVNPG